MWDLIIMTIRLAPGAAPHWKGQRVARIGHPHPGPLPSRVIVDKWIPGRFWNQLKYPPMVSVPAPLLFQYMALSTIIFLPDVFDVTMMAALPSIPLSTME